MKQIITLTLMLWSITLIAQQATGYEVHTCKSGHCGVLTFTGNHENQLKSDLSGTNEWCEPIRVSIGIQEGINISNATIEAAIAEDSDIAINDGLYTGTGPAYIIANIFTFSPNELTDQGLPFIVNSVSAAFSTINFNGNVGTIYDSQVLESRECYSAQMMYVIVNNTTPGIQELATINVSPNAERNPTIVFKEGAFITGVRNHGISHAAGSNAPEHENGTDLTKRPLQVGNEFSFGWSSVGNAGFSGGSNLGIGPDGENLAGHIADGYNTWLTLIPNLTAEITLAPTELGVNEVRSFEANINKDIGNQNWEWLFTNGGSTITETGNPISVSFDEVGTWTYQAIVTNDCEGQSDTIAGTFIVNASIVVAPTALCQDLIISIGDSGVAIVSANDIDGGSTDPDGNIVSKSINGTSELFFDCSNLGSNVVNLVVTDNDGLIGSCSATVTVIDDVFPTIECIGDVTIQLAAGQDTTLDVSDLVLDVTDNCGVSSLTATQLTFDAIGTYPIAVEATDDSGNQSECTINVTVNSALQAPVANCQNLTIVLDEAGRVVVSPSDIDNNSSDSDGDIVSLALNGQSELTFDCSDLGSNVVNLVVTDNDGLIGSCSATVTVIDDVSPTIECIGDVTIQLASGQDTTLDVSDLVLDVTDNCGVSSLTATQLTFDAIGTYPIGVGATDDSGNQSDCIVNVTVDVSSSVINVTNDSSISIFPNPVSDVITIRTDVNVNITQVVLFDQAGRKIWSKPYFETISVEELPTGSYSLVITTDNNVHRHKLVKN